VETGTGLVSDWHSQKQGARAADEVKGRSMEAKLSVRVGRLSSWRSRSYIAPADSPGYVQHNQSDAARSAPGSECFRLR